jgi:hypothetical protein
MLCILFVQQKHFSMKIPFAKNLFVKSFLTIVATFMLIIISPPALPQEFVSEESSYALQVKFIGGDNDALFFNVKYDNKAGNTFRLSVLDETGEACFQDNFSTRDFEKKIKIPRLTDTDYVIFLIRSAKENIQLSYKVKVTTKVVDETVFLKNRELVSYK